MKKNLKWNLKNVVFLLAMLNTCLVFGQNPDPKKRIIIDVGHGGHDSGAVGIHGIKEKDIVLTVARNILNLNDIVLNGKLELYMTRYRDTFISLSDRGRLAKALYADVFVSLHCNASLVNSKGMEVYAHNSDNAHLKASTTISLAILNESSKKLGFGIRGVKFSNFQVLRDMSDFCPAVLIELGFVTNWDEASYFLKPTNIKALALAILMGIINYLRI
ncbi:N-acetylmuramoyl-L-alanine amidase family protein [Confluentibacter flavum]|uniref:N-acetylmuramoyl-L-alanine amidase n=1 Tax=Confluentibacter flavum TaxID=1909700 RepID=A0A2N3HHE2_9FLAO|nr:N-acetylmuramoyl-L-alanine amidase [Confluentibacter flavum]PKQ44228.1 N-acetylmuramoyl-L-alanine amidase [Confluentibacter flavum]